MTGRTLFTVAAARESNDMKYPREAVAYVATPYTKFPHGQERAFVEAARITSELLHCGLKVYSPIVHCHALCLYSNLDPLDYKLWQPLNDAMLSLCDVLIVAHMEGWKESVGVKHEIETFERAGKKIFDLNPDSFVMVQRVGSHRGQ